ncbi:MAG: hypothetical protein MRZ79_00280 [Bacteroidia bacterium]|nr:hypothetical protein [Bacteroidia bacterium]
MNYPGYKPPTNFKIFRENGHLVMLRSWWGLRFIFLTLFVIFWDSLILQWYNHLTGRPLETDFDFLSVIFPIFHVAMGICLTYYTIAGYLNKTIMVVGNGSLSITHDPMWWPGNRSYAIEGIKQLYVKLDEHDKSSSYSIWMVDHENCSKKLIDFIEDLQEAIFIEESLEREMGIEDMPVKGEAKHRHRN